MVGARKAFIRWLPTLLLCAGVVFAANGVESDSWWMLFIGGLLLGSYTSMADRP